MKSALNNLKSLGMQRTFARSVTVLAGGTALGQGLMVISSPILTRIYSPEDFGVLSVFVSLFSILLVMNSLRYEVAIPMAETDELAAHLFVLVIMLVVLTTVIYAVCFTLWGETIFQAMNAPELNSHIGLLLVSLLFGGFYQALNFWAIRRQKFNVIAHSKLAQGLGTASLQLGLGLISPVTFSLLSGIAGGQIASAFPLLRLISKSDYPLFQRIKRNTIWEMANRYRRFPLWTSWSSFLNTAGLQLPAIFMVTIYGTQVGGWFSLSQRIIGLPMALVGAAVAQVYFSRATQMASENPDQLYSLYMRTARRLLLIGILPIGLLAVTGPWLFTIIFGEEWRATGQYVQIMAPLYLVHFVVSSLGQNIYVIERQDIQSMWDVFRLILLIGIFWLGSTFQLDAMVTISLYTIVILFAYIIIFFLNLYALRQFATKQSQPLSTPPS